jgi:hypothetical protein
MRNFLKNKVFPAFGGSMKHRILLSLALLLMQNLVFAQEDYMDGWEWDSRRTIGIETSRVSPKSLQKVRFFIARAGMVSIQVESALGSSLLLEDRMNGTLKSSGVVGESDGRIDILLDPGEYRLQIRSADTEPSDITIQVLSYTERNTTQKQQTFLRFPYAEIYSDRLVDLEKRSFWFTVDESDPRVFFEAAGRNLSEVQIWQDGQILVERLTSPEKINGKFLRELNYFAYDRHLLPGLYQFRLMGGDPLTWVEEDLDEQLHPLYYRFGIDELGSSYAELVDLSPLGRKTFLVPKNTYIEVFSESYGIVTLDSAALSELSNGSGEFHRNSKVRVGRNQVSESNPLISLRTSNSHKSFVTITGNPGEQVEFRVFPSVTTLPRSTDSLISGIASIASRDSLDMTSYLYNSESGELITSNSIPLGPDDPVVRITAMFRDQIMYLNVLEAGKYRLIEDEESSGSNRYYFWDLGEANEFEMADSSEVNLNTGIYRLRVRQTSDLGAVKFALVKSGLFSGARAQNLFDSELKPVQEGFLILGNNLRGDLNDIRMAYSTQNSSIGGGVDIHELPLKTDSPVLLAIAAGEELSIDLASPDPVSVAAVLQDAEVQFEQRGSALTMSHDADYTVLVQIEKILLEQEIAFVYPPSVVDQLRSLEPGKALYADYRKNVSLIFAFKVEEPGYYRLETTGRLDTYINLRSLVNLGMESTSSGGSGRNAALTMYFRRGEYIVQVAPRGESEGRAGLRLKPLKFRDIGLFNVSSDRNIILPSDEGAKLVLSADAGVFTAAHQSNNFPLRVEDMDGWLVSRSTSFSTDGGEQYRVYSMPVEQKHRRRLTFFPAVESNISVDPSKAEVDISLNSRLNAVWNEREEPHNFLFNLSADAPVSISLSNGMKYELFKDGSLIEKPDIFTKGSYRIAVRSIEEENEKSYSISLSTSWLLPGIPLSSSSDSVTLSIAEKGIYDIQSLSSTDVQASLYDNQGNLLFSNRDRSNGWDFLISGTLEAGVYTLKISSENASSRLSSNIYRVFSRQESLLQISGIPFRRDVQLAREALSIPFEAENTALYKFSARHPEVERVQLYKGSELIAEHQNTIYIPLFSEEQYVLRVLSTAAVKTAIPVSMEYVNDRAWDVRRSADSGRFGPFILSGHEGYGVQFISSADLYYAAGAEIPLKPLDKFPKAFSSGPVWIMAMDSFGAPVDSNIQAIVLAADSDGFATILEKSSLRFSYELRANTLLLAEMRTQNSFIGMRFSAAKEAADSRYQVSDMYPGYSITAFANTGAAVNLQGHLWNADPDSDNQSIGVDFTEYPLEENQVQSGTNFVLQPRTAVSLPGFLSRQVRFLLAKGLVLLDQGGGEVYNCYTSRTSNREIVTSLIGDEIYLVNTSEEPASFRIEEAGSVTQARVSRIQPWEGFVEGSMRLRTTSSGPLVIFAPGLEKPPILFGLDGSRRFAEGFSQDGYRIDAVPGYISIEGSVHALLRYGDMERISDIAVDYEDALKKAEGDIPVIRGEFIEAPGWYSFSCSEEEFVQFSSDSGGYVVVEADETGFAFDPDSANYSGYFQPGSYMVYLRALDSSAGFTVTRKAPEELPPDGTRFFLKKREEQLFRLTVETAAKVGIGAKAEAELVTVELLDSDFQLLGKGILLFRDLEPGEYLIRVIGADVPIQYSLIVLGEDGSKQGIPDDIRKSYQGGQ